VRLEGDVRGRDRYGRLLAHVHAEDGVWVNREMVRRGYAVVAVYPPNVRYVEEFRAELDSARRAGRGLWAVGGFACEPADRRRGRC
jgi:micrococcal nuclease